ncbi:MAG: hypothetical protein M3256_05920 [Actinomycetota bacterium]|nr:hypothetical protein [Actinomycetota bacterium]
MCREFESLRGHHSTKNSNTCLWESVAREDGITGVHPDLSHQSPQKRLAFALRIIGLDRVPNQVGHLTKLDGGRDDRGRLLELCLEVRMAHPQLPHSLLERLQPGSADARRHGAALERAEVAVGRILRSAEIGGHSLEQIRDLRLASLGLGSRLSSHGRQQVSLLVRAQERVDYGHLKLFCGDACGPTRR